MATLVVKGVTEKNDSGRGVRVRGEQPATHGAPVRPPPPPTWRRRGQRRRLPPSGLSCAGSLAPWAGTEARGREWGVRGRFPGTPAKRPPATGSIRGSRAARRGQRKQLNDSLGQPPEQRALWEQLKEPPLCQTPPGLRSEFVICTWITGKTRRGGWLIIKTQPTGSRFAGAQTINAL